MSYKIFMKDKVYPWDIASHKEGPWHIANSLEEFMGYIKNFGIPSSVSLFGTFATEAAAFLIDLCRDMGVKFPSYHGSRDVLDYINDARSRGYIRAY